MSQPLPQLPKPEFVLITIEAPPEVPTQIAVDLRETGIPGGLIGYEYRPLSEPVHIGGIAERGLAAIATSGLSGRIVIDLASGQVVQIPNAESSTAHHLNRDLDSFNRCIAAVTARFPFMRRATRRDSTSEELWRSEPKREDHASLAASSRSRRLARDRRRCPRRSGSRSRLSLR